MYIFIGGAWPYANGSMHLGHLAALLPGDVLARYHRQNGDNVLYVSGSDCHGTPIVLKAKSEKVSPSEIADRFHNEFSDCFEKLGFSYDIYNRTDDPFHCDKVKEIIKEIYKNGYIIEKEVKELYCENCKMALADRFVEGTCPVCKKDARGDQCDHCGTLLDPLELENKRCKTCNSEPIEKNEKQLFFRLSAFQEKLEKYLSTRRDWRKNSLAMTERYLNEGLVDRALSRDLPWGIDVPIEGFENKKIYVWFDAVLGYLTSSIKLSQERDFDWKDFWSENAKSYFVHGKDNIPFHSLILPAQLMAFSDLKLPEQLVSSEYLTLENRKFSTSQKWAVWVPDIVNKYNPDSIRYFLLSNGPEKKDADFSWREFLNANNSELLGAYGNLINRTLVFLKNNFGSVVPQISDKEINLEIENELTTLFDEVSELIEKAEFKAAIENIFSSIRNINKYFDEEKPWITVKENKKACEVTIYNCINAIKSFAVLLNPFIPFSSEKILSWLSYDNSWKYERIKPGITVAEPKILFDRLDKKIIDEELSKLGNN